MTQSTVVEVCFILRTDLEARPCRNLVKRCCENFPWNQVQLFSSDLDADLGNLFILGGFFFLILTTENVFLGK